MKFLTMLAIVLGLGLSSVTMDVEAKRFGGGRSLGMKRQAAPPKAPANTNAAAAPAAGAAGAAAPKRSWMGPIAGIAAGLGLAALASHLGLGEGMGSMLLIGIVAILVLRFMMRKKAASAQAASGPGFQGMGYATAGVGQNDVSQPRFNETGVQGGSMIGSQLGGSTGFTQHAIPADFDVAAFERNAKVNFIRLQAAHDAGDLEDIRQFTSPEVFAEIRMDLNDRGTATSQTDVLRLEATVTDVAEENDRYIVSVRFNGAVREDQAPTEEPVDEIWHMTKSRQGSTGWVVAGIQQTH